MREIKFRGQDIKGNWYYGNLTVLKLDLDHVNAGTYISNRVGLPFAYQVRPETVGQFIILKDKNGKEIYEGDILKITNHWSEYWNNANHEVKFTNGKFRPFGTGDWEPEIENVEIIGNVHENPGLLKDKST